MHIRAVLATGTVLALVTTMWTLGPATSSGDGSGRDPAVAVDGRRTSAGSTATATPSIAATPLGPTAPPEAPAPASEAPAADRPGTPTPRSSSDASPETGYETSSPTPSSGSGGKPKPKPSPPSTPTPSTGTTGDPDIGPRVVSSTVFDLEIDADIDAVTATAFAGAAERWSRLFTGLLAPARYQGKDRYRKIHVEVVHDPSISSSMSARVTSTRTDGTALAGLIKVRDRTAPVSGQPAVREALAAHELAHLVINDAGRSDYCTAAGWTGPLALAAYALQTSATASAVPTKGSETDTASCGHWSATWAHPYGEPDRVGPGPTPEILSPSVGSYSVIGPVTVAMALDLRPTLPLDLALFEAYPTA